MAAASSSAGRSWLGAAGYWLTVPASGDFVRHGVALEAARRLRGAFEVHASWAAVEQDDAPTVYASKAAYELAGIGPEDVDVIQLQDTDAGAEVIHLAENGFCADGDQEQLIADGAT